MSGKKRKGYDRSVYRSFALIMQFGINMLVPICIMSALGIYIDRKLETNFVMIILFFVGAFAGARNVYRMAKYNMESKDSKLHYDSRVYRKDGENNKERDHSKSHVAGHESKDASEKGEKAGDERNDLQT